MNNAAQLLKRHAVLLVPNHNLGAKTINSHVFNAGHSPYLLQRLGHALATVTTFTDQVDKIYSTLDNRHGVATSCWGTGELILPTAVVADARCSILG